MSATIQTVTVSGQFVTSEEIFWGRVSIDLSTGLICNVERGHELPANHTFGCDCYIFAGFGDVHIHAREDDTGKQCYKETYQTAGDAALNGGVVHVSVMPNTPNPVVDLERLKWHRRRVNELDHPVTKLNYVGIDDSTHPIGKRGEYPYKLYFGKSVGTLTVTYGSQLERILRKYSGEHISFHVEYEPIVQNSIGGWTHSDRRPVECVNEGLRLLLPLIEEYGIKAKLCHWSTAGDSFDLIQKYRNRGAEILLEVSPLHLLFDTSMTERDPSLWMQVQMNPAIQSSEHRFGLVEGLRSGFIDMLATDHAPHTEEEKFGAFAKYTPLYPSKKNKAIAHLLQADDPNLFAEVCVENNHSGAPWLDVYGPVCVWLMRNHAFKPQDIARVAACNPGKFVQQFLPAQFPGCDFGRGFGNVAEGNVGSLTVLNAHKKLLIDRRNLKTKVGWSPLEGREMPGGVEAVFVAGHKH